MQNYIQVPLNYHINWYPKYSTYVVLNVNGDNSYFVRVRRYENKIYFADGIKEFRSAMKLYENMVIRFSATDKNTTSSPDMKSLSAKYWYHGSARVRTLFSTLIFHRQRQPQQPDAMFLPWMLMKICCNRKSHW